MISFSSTTFQPTPTAEEIISRMQEAINNIKTLRYTLKNTERIDGKLLSGTQKITLNASPRKCYVYMLAPKEGAELLFVEGENDNMAIYNPNGFPYFKINLDPFGNLMRENNHHTIYELGFTLLESILDKIKKQNGTTFTDLGSVNWDNKSCHRISITDKTFRTVSYTVQQNETIRSIAQKKGIGEYMILELNEKLHDFGDTIVEGQKISIPSSYAKHIELYIDKETFLPLFQEISDHKGVYEQYEYRDILLNPGIPEITFTPSIFDTK